MATVAIVKNGNVDGALKALKQKNNRDGLLKEARKRQDGYMKPGERRREAKKEGIKNSRKRERMNNRAY
jgi:ribosomal protein S21